MNGSATPDGEVQDEHLLGAGRAKNKQQRRSLRTIVAHDAKLLIKWDATTEICIDVERISWSVRQHVAAKARGSRRTQSTRGDGAIVIRTVR